MMPLLFSLGQHSAQSAWSILVHCAPARVNHVARVVEPLTARHDIELWRCLCAVVQISPNQPEDVVEAASLPMVLGGVGLRSAVRVSEPAYWASWMDTPEIAEVGCRVREGSSHSVLACRGSCSTKPDGNLGV